MDEKEEVDAAVKVQPKVSRWRKFRQLFTDVRSTWRRQTGECPTSWRSIRSGLTWCCLLLITNGAYWLFGGLLFASLEGWHETRYKCGALRIRRHFIEELWEQSALLPEDEWRTMARQKLVEFEDQLHEAFSAGLTSYSGKRTWGYWDGVAFSMTTVSTIGYGHIVPVTWLGRLATIAYSLFGIPLFLVLLADCGLLLTRIVKFYWVYLVRFRGTASGERITTSRLFGGPVRLIHNGINKFLDHLKSKRFIGPLFESLHQMYKNGVASLRTTGTFAIDDQFDLSAFAALLLLFLYLLWGTIIFFLSEEWSPMESFYFVFISLTTIGFGDYVPQHPMALLTCVVYIIFGLALTGLCLNSIQVEMMTNSEHARTKLFSMLGLQMSGNETVELEDPLIDSPPPHQLLPAISESVDECSTKKEQ